jgi:hypothetical protein
VKLLILSHNPGRASFRQRIAVHVDILKANGIECEIEKGIYNAPWAKNP